MIHRIFPHNNPKFYDLAQVCASKHRRFALFNSCHHPADRYGNWKWMIAASNGCDDLISNWQALKNGLLTPNRWLIGIIGSGIRLELEPLLKLQSRLPDFLGLPPSSFFEPQWVIARPRNKREIHIWAEAPEELLNRIERQKHGYKATRQPLPQFRPLMSRNEYRFAFNQIKEHIRAGDVYELNLTSAFKTNLLKPLDLLQLYRNRLLSNPVPMAACIQTEAGACVSLSPERMIQLHPNGRLIAQPIKGTVRRALSGLRDQHQKQYLRTNEKFRAENVMIVDLLRNDLNRICVPGSVNVPDLFAVESFRKLHHLISTIEGQLKPDLGIVDVIQSVFPPGSMTGAPKIRALQLVQQYESCEREWYAGAAGWLAPDGSSDWNVLIRSLVFDASQQNMGYHVGGAITWDSTEEEEWRECRLKASQFVNPS